MVKNITPAELKRRLDSGESLIVIDVREDWELAITRVPFATHIPMDEIIERVDEIPKDRQVVFMCKAGGRSAQVASYLATRGYPDSLNLEGGILNWARQVDPKLPTMY